MAKITMGSDSSNQPAIINDRNIEPIIITEKIFEIVKEEIDLSPIINRLIILENKSPSIQLFDASQLEDRLSKLEKIQPNSIKEIVMDSNYVDIKIQEIDDRIEFLESSFNSRIDSKCNKIDHSDFKEKQIVAYEDLKEEIRYLANRKIENKIIEKENKFFKPLVIINIIMIVLSLITIIRG